MKNCKMPIDKKWKKNCKKFYSASHHYGHQILSAEISFFSLYLLICITFLEWYASTDSGHNEVGLASCHGNSSHLTMNYFGYIIGILIYWKLMFSICCSFIWRFTINFLNDSYYSLSNFYKVKAQCFGMNEGSVRLRALWFG